VEVTKPPKPSMQRVASGDSASRQAITRVNAEQASKGLTWEPTRRENGEGRRHWGTGGHTPRSDSNQWSHRGIGDGMSAKGDRTQHGKPHSVEVRDLQPDAREGQAGPTGVTVRLAVPLTPGNSGRGKGPEFKISVTKSVRARRLA